MSRAIIPDFQNFQPVMHPFNIPRYWTWYRCCDPAEGALGPNPRYYGTERTANLYAEGRVKKSYRNTRPLKILDIRYLKSILRELVACRRNVNVTTEVFKFILYVNVAFGICSMERQMFLLGENGWSTPSRLDRMKNFYDTIMNDWARRHVYPTWLNIVEVDGCRVGITDLDYIVIVALKALFGDMYDGIIAPAMRTPYHGQGPHQDDPSKGLMLEELVLFSPNEVLEEIPLPALAEQHHIQMGAYLFNTYALNQYQNSEFLLEHHAPQMQALQHIGGLKMKTVRSPSLDKKNVDYRDWAYELERYSPDQEKTKAVKEMVKGLQTWIQHVRQTFPMWFLP